MLFPPKNPKETGKQLLQFTFHIEATESRGGPRSRGGKLLHVLSGGLQILHMQYTLENEGGGGVFLLEVQYSILKSLISTCVLSYVGSRESIDYSREDWLLDRICES